MPQDLIKRDIKINIVFYNKQNSAKGEKNEHAHGCKRFVKHVNYKQRNESSSIEKTIRSWTRAEGENLQEQWQ